MSVKIQLSSERTHANKSRLTPRGDFGAGLATFQGMHCTAKGKDKDPRKRQCAVFSYKNTHTKGLLVQLVARESTTLEVSGSNPLRTTSFLTLPT